MKRQTFTLLMFVLVLVTGTILMAQTNTGSTLPPSQQVDQTGKPETGTGPDVDVDVGRNADNGVMNVDVDRHTDADTKAESGDRAAGTATTGTTGTTNTGNTYGTTGSNYDNTTTGTNANNQGNLPDTGSEMPLLGLIGLLSLAGTVTIRSMR